MSKKPHPMEININTLKKLENMSNSQPGYYERLLDESLHGNKYSLKELKFMAGAGEAAAQYYLALYYEQTSKATLKENGNYVWWIGKAAKANYMDSISRFNAVKPAPEYPTVSKCSAIFQARSII